MRGVPLTSVRALFTSVTSKCKVVLTVNNSDAPTDCVSSLLQDALRQTEYTYGLIQRSFVHLFDVLGQRSGSNVNYTLSASYLEIYNEQVGPECMPPKVESEKHYCQLCK